MDADAGQSDQAEQQEARRNGVVGELCRHQRGEIERDLGIELALAVLALAEGRWQLDRAQAAARRRQDVEQDLETLRRERRRDRLERIAPDHEMPAHRVGELDAEQETHHRIRSAADAGALLRKAGGGPAIEIAAGHRDIGASGAQGIQHGNEQPLVMLKVGVHHRDVAGLARQHAFEASSGEAAPADAADAAYAAVVFADGARGGGGAVRRIVVDENNLPVAGREKPRQPLDQDRNIGVLVEGRHDDGEFGRRAHGRDRVRVRRVARTGLAGGMSSMRRL